MSCTSSINHWSSHEPLLREILLFLSPQFVFISARAICSRWKCLIESKSFSSLYFHTIIAHKRYATNEEENDHEVMDTHENGLLNRIHQELVQPFQLNVNWDYLNLLKCIGMHKVRKCQNPLELCFRMLDDRQLSILKRILSKLKLTNLLKGDLVVELCHSSRQEMIMFRDDGIPIHFDGTYFNFKEMIIWFFESPTLKVEFGIQKHEFVKYVKQYLEDSVVIQDVEFQVLEDFLVLLHPQTRLQAGKKANPKPSRFIRMDDEEADKYFEKIENFVPDLDW